MKRANFLTVEEAGRVLRIGRTAAYEAAKRFRTSGGTDGIPVVAVGGSLRVPVPRLEQRAGGPLDLSALEASSQSEEPGPALELVRDPDATSSQISNNERTRARASRPSPQLDLFGPPAAG